MSKRLVSLFLKMQIQISPMFTFYTLCINLYLVNSILIIQTLMSALTVEAYVMQMQTALILKETTLVCVTLATKGMVLIALVC